MSEEISKISYMLGEINSRLNNIEQDIKEIKDTHGNRINHIEKMLVAQRVKLAAAASSISLFATIAYEYFKYKLFGGKVWIKDNNKLCFFVC